jgi:succinate-semialdehyde dehydrogenase/glutarate-semialdehyde dehydrogenase
VDPLDPGKAHIEPAAAPPRGGRGGPVAIASTNPATGETVKTYDEMSEADVERCLAAAAAASDSYRLTSFAERAGWMRRAAAILDEEQDQIAAMMTTEMGKTLAAARQEVAKCATACRYYAEHAERFLADEPADAGAVGARDAADRAVHAGPVRPGGVSRGDLPDPSRRLRPGRGDPA